ncbi:uncharacterized protein FOMMEDRAFT_23792 [Fomitiporia mediterranea MF3/22]|uniref:uncharacterized protein n=1 Tax=Fomitiporia mediterranea (strain MF3/22) TaxID=694068 RepID=UPI00044086FC|nr:uncharacterized protein FOMMEDRAFT_23792 [Fomitiporia mediterranea MF3/22]EJC98218.1 hypothetical protein FOMMEDRAFT_23792 [Fomitiporia mediterranea MF3/22]
MVAVPSQPPARPPALNEATKRSTTTWQEDLQSLFHRAKDRFPDVVWDLLDEDAMDDGTNTNTEEVWGHKAIVYARAPPTFQARYFSFRPAPVASPIPYAASPTPSLPMPTTSALSLNLGVEFPYPASMRSVSPSHFRPISPASSMVGALTRISLSHNPALFSNELEYLYTGKGFGDAFEFLFDANEKGPEGDTDVEEARIDKLRKDLVFMWRSRLYSDVRIELHNDMPVIDNSATENEEETRPVFSSHRFVLVTRSPYFYDQLITYGVKNAPPPGELTTLRLPSPPFTAPALHFTLGYLYTGTLHFSNRSYDLDTAFAILSSANYLQLQPLYDEVQARLVQEMLHGLFHAFLEFAEYERITGGRWGTGGCRCRQCARRAPRTLLFAVRPDVQNTYLERGARRALVGLFGEGWCNGDFAGLPQKTKDGLMTGLKKRVVPQNVFPLLFAAHTALAKLISLRDAWVDGVREMITTARGFVDTVLCNEAEKCFNEREWVDIMENDGMGRFEDGERVEWVMEAVRRGMSESNAGMLYQTLVSAILIRPNPNEPTESLLSGTSQIRVQVEQTRMDLLRWMRRRWAGIRNEGGFDSLESWAIKEISDEINIPVEDLLTPTANGAATLRAPLTRTGLRPTLSRVEDTSERESVATAHSLRASVLNKNHGRGNGPVVASSGASVRSVARSVASTTSRASSRLTTATERERKESRPDSKLAPSSSRSTSFSTNAGAPIQRASSSLSYTSGMDVDGEGDGAPSSSVRVKSPAPARSGASSSTSIRRPIVAARSSPRIGGKDTTDSASALSINQLNVVSVQRPKSSAASVTSTRSHASTIRRNAAATGQNNTLRPSPQPARPTSSLSNVSVSSSRSATSTRETKFRTPVDSASVRSRKISTTSTASVRSTAASTKSPKTPAPTLPKGRPRRASETTASSATVSSRMRKVSPNTTSSTAGATTRSPANKTPTLRKSPSASSIKSTASAATAGKKTSTMKKSSGTTDEKKTVTARQRPGSNKPLPKMPSKENIDPEDPPNTASTLTIREKGKGRADAIIAADRKSLRLSDNGSSTTRATLRRKESNDTITLNQAPAGGATVKAESTTGETVMPQPRGATLDIGIPCIITSKRKRFRAFARYIGEVEGERGPWVGVEVPVGESWVDDQNDGRQWNDGSWGGVRYFDVGSQASEWGDDERLSRRRRMGDLTNGGYGSTISAWKGTKREGEQLSVDRKKRFRSASPSVSEVSNAEYRGLFVRPQQVLYVVDAVGSDL